MKTRDKSFFDGPAATLEQILQSRTDRAARQQQLLCGGCRSLISFTLNIPGAVKQFSLARRAHEAGTTELERCFSKAARHFERTDGVTGSEAFFALDLPARQAKQSAVLIEETHPLGRLFDIDVIDAGGEAVSRSSLGIMPRKCLLCSSDAKGCARSRAHSPEQLLQCVMQILDGYFGDSGAGSCPRCDVHRTQSGQGDRPAGSSVR